MHPRCEGHRDEIKCLVQQAVCGNGIYVLDRLAHAEQEIINQSFKRTVASKSGRGQRVERADALLQKLPRHLEDRLRKAIIEAQLVGAGGVVDHELSGRYDRFAAILEDAVHAAVSQGHQHEIFARACNPGWCAENPLCGGVDLRKRHRTDPRLRNRTPKRVLQIRPAIEPNEDVADDVLPDRKSSIRSRRTRVEHNSHDGPPGIIR
jgi:hypothetical protein